METREELLKRGGITEADVQNCRRDYTILVDRLSDGEKLDIHSVKALAVLKVILQTLGELDNEGKII